MDEPPTKDRLDGYVIQVQAVIKLRPEGPRSPTPPKAKPKPPPSLPTDGWPTDAAEFGRAVRQARRQLEMSQFAFAEHIGISSSTLTVLENGHRKRLRRSSREWIVRGLEGLGVRPPSPATDATDATHAPESSPPDEKEKP